MNGKMNSIPVSDGREVSVLHYDVIDSTNLEAKRQIKQGAKCPFVVVADAQTAGKGRMGRQFYSPDKTGLYMSFVYEPETDFKDSVTVTSAAAVAVVRAIEELTDLSPKIKWVNDIYIDDKKVSGILTEAVTGDKTSIIVGIGVNITTDKFPNEIKNTATSLNQAVDKNNLLLSIVKHLLELISGLPQRTFLPKYKQKSMVIGKDVCFIKDGISKEGIAVDINQNGALVVQTADGLETLSTGEITLRVK
ncbi:MAG: biotin--[Clostridia bacterium]|nr:biotin--[acetyl-CoA-carboxylase] ligase [Clostridia bacterium]